MTDNKGSREEKIYTKPFSSFKIRSLRQQGALFSFIMIQGLFKVKGRGDPGAARLSLCSAAILRPCLPPPIWHKSKSQP